MQNRYPGPCACGAYVHAEEGVAFRHAGRWQVRCANCEGEKIAAAVPEREMLGTIYWPNGMGETVCTLEYEEAVFEAQIARRELEDYRNDAYDPHDRESVAWVNTLEHKVYGAENKVASLQADGGHMGERITYAQADPMTALLGGGQITVAPGGAIGVAA